MFDNVLETVALDSNTVTLNIPKKDFLFMYEDYNRDSAQNYVDNYFREKRKDGIPFVSEITVDEFSHTVKISIEVNYNRDFKLDQFETPDALNGNRNYF